MNCSDDLRGEKDALPARQGGDPAGSPFLEPPFLNFDIATSGVPEKISHGSKHHTFKNI
jgi:hypothetical protein